MHIWKDLPLRAKRRLGAWPSPPVHADAEIQVVDLSHPARDVVAMQKAKTECSHLRSNFYLGKRSHVAALEEDIDMKQSAKCHETGLSIHLYKIDTWHMQPMMK